MSFPAMNIWINNLIASLNQTINATFSRRVLKKYTVPKVVIVHHLAGEYLL